MNNKFFAILVIWTASGVRGADIADGANKKEHTALCTFVALAQGKIEVAQKPAIDTETYNYIQALNFSTAEREWQDSFYKDGEKTKVHDDAQEYHKKSRILQSTGRIGKQLQKPTPSQQQKIS